MKIYKKQKRQKQQQPGKGGEQKDSKADESEQQAKAGDKKEEVSFVRVVVWGKMAEVCGEYLAKGRPVLVEGRLKSRSWEDQTGQKRSAMDVVANSVQFLGSRPAKQQEAPAGEVGSIDLNEEYSGSGGSEDLEKKTEEGEIPF